MIYAFTGKTGSGKTFNMVNIAYDYYLRGIDVYSNTNLFFGKSGANIEEHPEEFTLLERIYYWTKKQIYKIFKKEITPLKRGRIIYFENINEILEAREGVIIFDEAQVLFNSRSWESLPDEFAYKLQQHRKHKLDLLCTTQNMASIDIVYRRLVQVWYHHERIFTFGKLVSMFRKHLKDTDQLYNKVDDLVADNIKTYYYFIGFNSRRLYDTLYDIGFKRYTATWHFLLKENKSVIWIYPKNMDLKVVQRLTFSMKSDLKMTK